MNVDLIISLIGVFFLIAIIYNKLHSKNALSIDKSSIFSKKPLTNCEQKMYLLLRNTFADKYIFTQVAFHCFLYVKGGSRKENFSLFSRFRQKTVDFLICDRSFKIECIIELDDKTHQKEKDRKRDAYTKEAGLQTIRYHVSNYPTAETLKRDLNAILRYKNEV